MDGDLMLYDFESLDALAGSIDGRVNAMQGLVDDLRSKVNNLAAEYQGAASEGFRHTKQQFETAANDLIQVLAKISIAVKKTREDAHHTEQQNTARW
jgi:early secretory antigenic target protein ESAT-6